MSVLQYVLDKMLILIPILNVLGRIIKGIDKIPDKYIPLFLLVFGVLGAIAIGGASVDSIIQGILITGAAVYGNQVVKQLKQG